MRKISKKISKNITLTFISMLLISLILMMTSLQIGSMLKIKSDVYEIKNLWNDVQVEQSEKLRLENTIRSFLGFGGMIHKFKDALLTNNIAQLDSIQSDLHSVETIIQLYLSFQLSNAERYALNDIDTTVKKYQESTKLLLTLIQQNTPHHKLDQSTRVNDNPALNGLDILAQYNRPEKNNIAAHPSNHDDKFILLTDLVAEMGYGGLIHHIKNLQLRTDSYYAIASQQKIDAIRLIINKFRSIPLTLKENNALNNLMHTVNFYQILLDNLKQPLNKQTATDSLKLLQADKEASNAIQVLQQYIEIELKSKIFKVGEKIHTIQHSIDTLIQIIIFLSICTLLLFAYIMFHKVIIPLKYVTSSMVLLARQGYKQNDTEPNKQIFEVRQIIRSLRIFKRHENKRRYSGKSLKLMHTTTLQQLNEIKELQAKSEQKTEQALTLANHLIDLQKSAEFDRNNALENQRRVNTILNTVHDAIITTNHIGIIESVNTASENMFGYRASELLGNNINQLIPDILAIEASQEIIDFTQKLDKFTKSHSEKDLKHADGSTFPVEIFLGQSEFNNEMTFTAVIRDITQRKKDEEEIQHLVLTDPLTNLANRRHFNRELKRAMENKKRLNLSVALLMIDLDNFKPINDTYGHNIGDKVLQRVATRLQNITRSVDLIARLGGDEFAIILNSVNDNLDAVTPANKIIETLNKPMNIDGQILKIGTTIGISVSPQDADSLEDFINRADKALYKGKSLGKGGHFSYQDLLPEEQ